MEEIVVVYYVEKMSKMGNFMLIRIFFYLFYEKGAIFTTRRSKGAQHLEIDEILTYVFMYGGSSMRGRYCQNGQK